MRPIIFLMSLLFVQVSCKKRTDRTSAVKEFETSVNFCSDTLTAVASRYKKAQGSPRDQYMQFLQLELRAIENCIDLTEQRKKNPFAKVENTSAGSGPGFKGNGCDVDTVTSMEQLDGKIAALQKNRKLAGATYGGCPYSIGAFCANFDQFNKDKSQKPTSCSGISAATAILNKGEDAVQYTKDSANYAREKVGDAAQYTKEKAAEAVVKLSTKAQEVKNLFVKNQIDPLKFLATEDIEKLCALGQELRRENLNKTESMGLVLIRTACVTKSPDRAYEFIADQIDGAVVSVKQTKASMKKYVDRQITNAFEKAKLAKAKVTFAAQYVRDYWVEKGNVVGSAIGVAWKDTKKLYRDGTIQLGEEMYAAVAAEQNDTGVDTKATKDDTGTSYKHCCECKKQVYVDDSYWRDSYLKTERYRSVIQGGKFSTSNCNMPGRQKQGFKFPYGQTRYDGKIRDRYYYYENCEKIRVTGGSCQSGRRY